MRGVLHSLFTTTALAALTAGAAVAQDDDRLEYETIVVTGEKIDRSIQETTTSIQVTTAADIEKLNIVDLEDVLRRIGNAGFVSVGSGRNDQFVLRGVQSQGVTGGTGTPVATLYVDGAVIPNQTVGAAISNGWDVRQFEVLRGAQSTVQGRNSLIGSIVVRTEDPTFDWDARARATYASENTWETSVAFGGPILDDQLAFRIAAQRLESDGFVTRADGLNGDEEASTLLRGKLLFTPDALPGLEVKLTGIYTDEEDGSVIVDGANPDARLQLADVLAETDRELMAFSSEISYDITDNLSIISQTSYTKYETEEVGDFDGLPADPSLPETSIRRDMREGDDFLQEIRFVYDNDDNFTALFGALAAKRGSDDISRVRQTFGVPALPLALFGLNTVYLNETDAATSGAASIPIPASAPNNLADPLLLGSFLPLASDFTFEPEFTTYAVFGEFAYDVIDPLTLTFGFRWEQEEADYTASQVNILLEASDLAAVTTGVPGLEAAIESALVTDLTPLIGASDAATASAVATPGIAAAYPGAAFTAITVAFGTDDPLTPIALNQSDTFDVFLPKFVSTYRWSDEISTSFSAQRAYRPGGLGINPVQQIIYAFDPEFSWNYELALRAASRDGKVIFNANAFYIDWSDQQLEVQVTPTPQDTIVINAGESELFGVEFQGSYLVSDSLDLFASIGLLSTEVTEAGDLTGDEFPFAPTVTATLGATWSHPSGFTATYDMNFQSESQAFLPNPDLTGPANDTRTISNLRIAYEQDNYSVFAFGSNIFDEVYLVNGDALGGNVIVGEPQVFGVGISLNM
ncbi:MAG: TonB-dependent receptor [Pseudomonadota bacterium]